MTFTLLERRLRWLIIPILMSDRYILPKVKKQPLWLVKLRNAEYWSSRTIYALLSPVLVWNAWRAKSLTFFTAVNPMWENGGMFGESKKNILDAIANEYKPITILADPTISLNTMAWKIGIIPLPLIVKPILGERGTGVMKINSLSELLEYHQNIDNQYIIQEFIDYPIELGVFYSRKPSEARGQISSITMKDFLSVTGNGTNSLEELIQANTRARFQEAKLRRKFASLWKTLIPAGQKIELEAIGNHCRGTRFINANYLITKQLEDVFETISRQIQGFQYGRFDLRVPSLEDLYAGKNIKIMELNGTNSEPTHVYDASHGFFRMYRDLAWHWTRLADISIENQQLGVKSAKVIPFLRALKAYLKIRDNRFLVLSISVVNYATTVILNTKILNTN